jgi:hypothetical protein
MKVHVLTYIISATCVGIGLAFLPTCGFAQYSIVVDKDSGTSISLENVSGKTIVTNLNSGEAIVVDGEYAGNLTDEEYSEMLRIQRALHKERTNGYFSDIVDEGGELKSIVASGNYSVSGGTGGFETPRYWISSTSVDVKIYGVCSRPGGDYVGVTLYRYISWWFDPSYGTKSYYVDNDGHTSTKTWSGLPSSKYYYLVIDKDYNGYSAYGTYTISD